MVNFDTDPITANLIAAMTADPRRALATDSVSIKPIDPADGVTRYLVAGVVSITMTLDELVEVLRGE